MEKKCSNSSHQENDAVSFCQECKIYMCNKCEKLHSEFIENHHQFKLSKDNYIDEIFTGLCKESNHQYELKYFCKTHNILCCAECITKIKGKDYGQHTDCEICPIEDITKDKINKLENNIKSLEELFLNLKDSINDLKLFFEKMEKDKEEIKLKIQATFTKIRNILNEKEDELVAKIDKKYKEEFFDENMIKESQSLPKKIEKSLEKGKFIIKNKENNGEIKLNQFINDCLNIENNINNINKIKNRMTNYNSKQERKLFFQNEEEIKRFCETINKITFIYYGNESEIVRDEDFIKINNWIGGNNKFILKYSTRRDTCNTNIFHEKCDNIQGSLLICKVINKDIIGGYISSKIEKKNEFVDDNKAFLFNLTKNLVKKNKKNSKRAIKNFNDSSYFIRFGSDCEVLSLSGNCIKDKKSRAGVCTCSNSNYDTDYSNIFNENSSSYFEIDVFEVFQVI